MKRNIQFIGLVLCSMFSCHDDETFSNKASSQFFPNMIGDYWEYSVIDSTNTGDGVKQYNVAITVVGIKKLVDNKDAFVWQYKFPMWVAPYSHPAGIDTLYVRIENDTVKTFDTYYSQTVQAFNFPRQIFPIPFRVNQNWSGNLLWVDSYAVSQAPGGYLINYHYVGPNTEYIDQLSFTPNIGFIKMDKSHYDLAPIDHQIWQLQKYSLK